MRRVICLAIALSVLPFISAPAATTNVNVGPGFAFTPPAVTVAPGDTVVWTFLGFHTTTSDTSTGAEVWNSGPMSTGTFSHTFTVPGTYPYYCSLHSSPGGTFMNGSVQVAAPVLPAPTVTGVLPLSALPGATVTITGTGFQNGATVSFRGTGSGTVTFVNSTTLQVIVPGIAPGAATIVVTNPDTLTGSFTGFVVAGIAIPAMSPTLLLLLALALSVAAVAIMKR